MYFLTQTSWAFLPPNSKENHSSISNQAFYIHVRVLQMCNHLRSFHYLVQAFRLVFWDRANQEDKFFRSCCTVACESLGKSRKDQKLCRCGTRGFLGRRGRLGLPDIHQRNGLLRKIGACLRAFWSHTDQGLNQVT